jgi:hypothetical protein
MIHAKVRKLVSQCRQGCNVDDPSQIAHLDGCLETLSEADYYYGYLLELSNIDNMPSMEEEEGEEEEMMCCLDVTCTSYRRCDYPVSYTYFCLFL